MEQEEDFQHRNLLAVLGPVLRVLLRAVQLSNSAAILRPVLEVDRSLSLPDQRMADRAGRRGRRHASPRGHAFRLAPPAGPKVAGNPGHARRHHIWMCRPCNLGRAPGAEVLRILHFVDVGWCPGHLLLMVPRPDAGRSRDARIPDCFFEHLFVRQPDLVHRRSLAHVDGAAVPGRIYRCCDIWSGPYFNRVVDALA